jgi:hypothetical protein
MHNANESELTMATPFDLEGWGRTALHSKSIQDQEVIIFLIHWCIFREPSPNITDEQIKNLQHLGWLDDDMKPSWPPGLAPEGGHDAA